MEFRNILSQSDISYIHSLPQVLAAKEKINVTNKVQFSSPLTESIRTALKNSFGLDLSNVNEIPLRWLKGDTKEHVDTGRSKFEKSYLVYLNDNPGKLVLDEIEYPILENSGYVFNEGVKHKTIDTGLEPRLLLGPMSEQAFAVGIPTPNIKYFSNETDALNDTNALGDNESDYELGIVTNGTTGGYTSWLIGPNSNGTSPQNVAYSNGDILNNDGVYYVYPNTPCFAEGTQILCQVNGEDTYISVQNIRVGTIVKTSMNGYKKVDLIGKRSIQNPGNNDRIKSRLYKYSKTKFPQLIKDLFITGCHSILVDSITDKQREESIKYSGDIYVTDNKYRLMACVDERAEPWNSEGTYTVWHFALENNDNFMNYGVYANGLLVESCSKRMMKEYSNLTLIQ
jgi:hypothetical protein